jgi:mannosyl-3-phosphoglycerate phosphatase
MVTSKTRAEVEVLQDRMGISQPFVVENGGGIFFPPGHDHLELPGALRREPYRLIQLGESYERIRSFLQDLPARFSVRGFGDMSLEEVCRATALPKQEARLARAREFTEPFLVFDEGEVEALEGRASAQGLKITRGGRFFHLMGRRQDKGEAVKVVREVFEARWNESCTTVGLGDSENDLPMLQAVDIPVLIPNPGGSPPEVAYPRLVRVEESGSAGWNTALQRILNGIV